MYCLFWGEIFEKVSQTVFKNSKENRRVVNQLGNMGDLVITEELLNDFDIALSKICWSRAFSEMSSLAQK